MQRRKIEDSIGHIVCWKSDVFDLSKDALFFLHGLTGNHTVFEQQFPAFAADYNMIAWDVPAHGESRPYSEKCGLKFDHYGEYTKLDGGQTFQAKFYKMELESGKEV